MPTLRLRAAASITCIVTFFLFFVMQFLIKSDEIKIEEIKILKFPDFVYLFKKSELVQNPGERKPEKLIQPPITDFDQSDTIDSNLTVLVTETNPPLTGSPAERIPKPTINSGLLSVVEAHPVYPHRALSKNIEGHVVVEFTVTKSASTDAVHVVEASPANIFDRPAIRAASKSRFKPQIIYSKAVAVKGIRKISRLEIED